MKRSMQTAAVLACAAVFLATTTASFAQGPTQIHHEHHLSAGQKQASDQAMQAGLSQLQSAAGAVQQGAGGAAISDLQSAVSALTSALPIYHGHREHAIKAAGHAIEELQKNGRRSLQHASVSIGKAISEAQLALQTN